MVTYQTITIEIDLESINFFGGEILDIYLDSVKYPHQVNPNSRSLIAITENLGAGDHRLSINFDNKNYHKSYHNGDTIVQIHAVYLQSLDMDFKQFGIYLPRYPQSWADEQKQIGKTLPNELSSHCMGWNGLWIIDFSVPIYRWMHKTLNLGWLI